MHDHSHHGHSHHDLEDFGPGKANRAFALGISLNLIFVAIEAVYGWWSGSLALVADAGHNLSDVMSLALAWGAAAMASRRPTPRRTYGFRRATILASLLSAILLLGALGWIAWEAIARFQSPAPVAGWTMIIVAAIGVVINTATALLFVAGRKKDLNLQGAFLHMAADAAVSLGVVIAGIAILWTGKLWLDPAISLVIVVVVLIGTWGLLRDSLNLAVDAVPAAIEPEEVREFLTSQPGVASLHDLHIWAMSTTESALTAHLVMPETPADDAFLHRLTEELHRRFDIDHATLQVERDADQAGCRQFSASCC